MKYVVLQLLLCINSLFALSQSNNNCFEIKHLDFFGIESLDSIAWNNQMLNQMLAYDFGKDNKDATLRTSFLIPFAIMQLRKYHPNCRTQMDTSVYNKLVALYFKLRQADSKQLNFLPLHKQLEYIRDDFYTQVYNDSLLPYMNYTLDDGPFYGESLAHNSIDTADTKQFLLDFGVLCITNKNDKSYITVLDRLQKPIFTKAVTVRNKQYLKNISFNAKAIKNHSLGYTIIMYAYGKRLTLEFKKNGMLRYYYYTW